MEEKNLLGFLNKINSLHVPEYTTCTDDLFNFLDLISLDEQFTQKIDAGLIFLYEKSIGHYTLIDGQNRLLSLSLLLHAICECHKKTNRQNEKAISIIRKKYLFNGSKTKLRLVEADQQIYEKILNGERLSGKEKKHPMFVLLHKLWTQIKEYQIPASNIFKILQTISITVIEATGVNLRDLYCSINRENRHLNQLKLVAHYLKEKRVDNYWENLTNLFQGKDKDILRFFGDFFLSRFNYKKFNEERVYEYFVNYFETMSKYIKADEIMSKMVHTASLYNKMLNVQIEDEDIKKAVIKLKMRNSDETYAYILSIYEDYESGTISKATFLEILSTVEDYLKKRELTPNNVSFNELIGYLNAFITYK